jgi:hypothetical protein
MENNVAGDAHKIDTEERENNTDTGTAPTSSSREFNGTKDRWGFLRSDEFHQYLQLAPEVLKERREKEQERTKKWLKMKKHWQRYGVPGRKHEKVLSRVRKGIPDCLRGFAWYQLCGAESIKQKIPDPWKLDMSTVSPVTIDDVRIPAPTSKYDVMLYYTDFTECRLDET